MGLGTVTEGGSATYLVIAGGFIWNKKADKSDPNYATQEWTNLKGEVNVREGARYKNLTGNITNVEFRTHEKYGEAIYVTVNSDGEDYILNVKTNTANSQSIMKALFMIDLNKTIYIEPYDYISKKDKKRKQGISFKQDGQDIKTWEFNVVDRFGKDWEVSEDFWQPSNKKKYLRWLEDLSDKFVAEIEEKIIPKLAELEPVSDNSDAVNELEKELEDPLDFLN